MARIVRGDVISVLRDSYRESRFFELPLESDGPVHRLLVVRKPYQSRRVRSTQAPKAEGGRREITGVTQPSRTDDQVTDAFWKFYRCKVAHVVSAGLMLAQGAIVELIEALEPLARVPGWLNVEDAPAERQCVGQRPQCEPDGTIGRMASASRTDAALIAVARTSMQELHTSPRATRTGHHVVWWPLGCCPLAGTKSQTYALDIVPDPPKRP